MNGRVYDPLLARFTSADTMTESPFSTQGWNRYSYVGNDPLTFTDPSGHCFLGCFWKSIGNAVSSAWKSVTHFFQTNAIARAILQIGATIMLNAVLPGLGLGLAAGSFGLAVASAAGGAMIATGLSGGNIGQVLKAGLIAGVTAAAFYGVGNWTGHQPQFGTDKYFANVAGHALVGCGSSVASGGDCKSGALSGAVGSALSPLTNAIFPGAQSSIGQRIGGTVLEAIAGGLASVAGGGKFANGAVTGAFGYLFNNLSCWASCSAGQKPTWSPDEGGLASEADAYQQFLANPELTYPLAIPAGIAGGWAFEAAAAWLLGGEAAAGGGLTVFAGHGVETTFAGETIVPDGVALTLPGRAGVKIPDALGQLIEAGNWEAIAANPRWASIMEGSQSFLPGARVPNLILQPPTGLTTLPGSVTVTVDTPLSTLLSGARGVCVWAACRATP
ncbi:membrane hypothetical protein [Bradyrhizobium sp. ORS 375]|nr:membrane hypothetical protein [Bradyrhizobium sp. ORS 375]